METLSALLALLCRNSPVNSPHKGQWRGALIFSLICAWTNGSVNSRDPSDLRPHSAHYDVIVMGGLRYIVIVNLIIDTFLTCFWAISEPLWYFTCSILYPSHLEALFHIHLRVWYWNELTVFNCSDKLPHNILVENIQIPGYRMRLNNTFILSDENAFK